MKLGWGYKDAEWYLLDATCLEFTKDRKFVEYVDYSFNHRSNTNGSLTHSGDIIDFETHTVTQTIDITLSKLPPTTHSLVFLITAYHYYTLLLFFFFFFPPSLFAFRVALRWFIFRIRTLFLIIKRFTRDLSASTLPWIRMSDASTSSELCQYSLDKAGTRTAVVMCFLQRNPQGPGWTLKVTGKLDDGNAPSGYLPVRNNIPALL